MIVLAELLDRLRRGAELVAVSTTGAAGAMLDFKASKDKWGVLTIVCHLADTELVLAVSIRQVIAEDTPQLPEYDQNLWADRLDYRKRKLYQAHDTFRLSRT